MLRRPRLVYRVALPVLVVLFGLSAIGRDRTPSEGGTYWVGAISWAAFGVLLLALIIFSVLVVLSRRGTGRGVMGTRRGAVGLVLVAGLAFGALGVTAPVGAQAERMHLECDSGLVIERSNGSSWWGVALDGSPDGSVYTTRYLKVVDADGGVVHEQHYGQKTDRHDSTTCVAPHFGWTWTVELVRAR